MSHSFQKIIHGSEILLPILDLEPNDLIWLEAIYAISKMNMRPTLRQVKKQLNDVLPKNYDPSNISYHLATSGGEEITLLGIIALERNYSIIDKVDNIIRALQKICLEIDSTQSIEASSIAQQAKLPENEVSLLLLLTRHQIRISSSSGARIADFYGIQFLHIDDAAYMEILKCENVSNVLLKNFENLNKQKIVDEDPGENLIQSTIATQVLAMHFLLKKCGINPIDSPTSVARFIQFMNGKELTAKRIQNTNIYKAVSRPLKTNDKSLIKDLLVIRQFFVEMELDDIVIEIDKEMQTCKKSG